MSLLTQYTPEQWAVAYVSGALLWAVFMGLTDSDDGIWQTLLSVALWPIAAALTVGRILRGLLSVVFGG